MLQKPVSLKIAEVKGYRFWLQDNNINYKFIGSTQLLPNIAKGLLENIKKEKQLAIQYLLQEESKYKNMIAVDIETTGLNPYTSDIRLISWTDESGSYVSEKVVDIAEKLKDPSILKVFHNAIFDVPFLIIKGYEVNYYTDSMVMSQIIGEKGQRHSLDSVSKRILDIDMDKSLQKEKNWFGEITQKHIDYSKKDAEITYKVATKLIKKIELNSQMNELDRNERVLPFAVRAKIDGIPFDKNGWLQEVQKYKKEKEDIETEILSELYTTINLNSPSQLKQTLINRGIPLENTSDDTLAKLQGKYPVLEKIREYRHLQKLVSSSSEKLIGYVDRDNRIRASWKINGTITGRMSCSNPNIQQIDHRIRPFFKASEGHIFIDCDYSQIELRIVAEISGDTEMINAFEQHQDLHIKTAQMIFGKEDISKQERQIAKTCNFGLIYGMSANGLKQRLKQTCNMDISKEKAELFRTRFFRLYKGIKRWQRKLARANRIETLGGKRWSASSLSYMEKYNYPVQGTGAEGLKESMSIIIDEIPDEWKICAIIHDEILLEVPKKDELEAKKKLEQWMIAGMSTLIKRVPIVAEASSSMIWEKA